MAIQGLIKQAAFKAGWTAVATPNGDRPLLLELGRQGHTETIKVFFTNDTFTEAWGHQGRTLIASTLPDLLAYLTTEAR